METDNKKGSEDRETIYDHDRLRFLRGNKTCPIEIEMRNKVVGLRTVVEHLQQLQVVLKNAGQSGLVIDQFIYGGKIADRAPINEILDMISGAALNHANSVESMIDRKLKVQGNSIKVDQEGH